MRMVNIVKFTGVVLVLLFVFFANSSVFAQGKANGKSKARPTASRGGQTEPDASKGRSNDGNATRVNQNRTQPNSRSIPDDKELNRFKGISRKLDTTPEILRDDYRAALTANPDLKFGQFVAANVIADNLSKTHPNITSSAILIGLEDGNSLGRTLKDLGLSSRESNDVIEKANKQIRSSKKIEDGRKQ